MSKLYQDKTLPPEQRAQALLEELSLSEKMAQVRGIFPFGPGWDDWEAISHQTKYGVGQVSTLADAGIPHQRGMLRLAASESTATFGLRARSGSSGRRQPASADETVHRK